MVMACSISPATTYCRIAVSTSCFRRRCQKTPRSMITVREVTEAARSGSIMALPFASMPIIPHCSTVCTSDIISDVALPFQRRGLVARCAAVFQFPLPTASGMDREAACTRRCLLHPIAARHQAVKTPNAPPMHGRPGCGMRTFLLRGGGERCPAPARPVAARKGRGVTAPKS
jgi:hypothetical protein